MAEHTGQKEEKSDSSSFLFSWRWFSNLLLTSAQLQKILGFFYYFIFSLTRFWLEKVARAFDTQGYKNNRLLKQ